MKYWMFQSNQVTGPYETDDLPTVAGYGPETLVCPEGRKGTSMGDWQRASMVPELSLSLLKVTQLATVIRGAGGIMAGLPPEPTLKDLAALGSLQERMELLDNTVAELQESLRLKDEELLSVHHNLDEKDRLARQLAVQLGALEERLGGVNSASSDLKQGLDQAVAAEHEVESTVQGQSRTIEELGKQLAELQAEKSRLESAMAGKQDLEDLRRQLDEIKELRQELDELKARPTGGSPSAQAPAESPSASGPKPDASLPSLEMPAPSASPFAPAPKPLDEPKLEPLSPLSETPKPDAAPAPLGGFTPLGSPAAAPAAALGAPPPGVPSLAPSVIPETVPPAATPDSLPPAGLPPAPAPGSVLPGPAIISSAAAAPAAKAKAKPNVFLFIVLGLGALGGYGALKLGLLGRRKGGPAALSDRAPLPPPMPIEPPPSKLTTPSPEEILEGRKKDAIALVNGWTAASGKTVGTLAAEGTTPPEGAATPWMAELMHDDLFQVNYYAAKPGLPSQTYEFEADLMAKRVAAHNEAAKELLEGKTAAQPKKPRRAGSKRKPAKAAQPAQAQDKPILEDLLIVNPDDDKQVPAASASEPSPPASEKEAPAGKKAARKSRIKPQNSINDLDAFLAGAAEPAPKPKVKPKGQAKKDESLDDLLVPGGGRKSELDEPQAQPAAQPKTDAADAESAADESVGAAPEHQEDADAKKKGSEQVLDDLLK